MKNSNIRRIDELGRIVIPKDIRKKLHIKDNEPLEIFIEDEEICIRKYSALPDVIEFIKYLVDMGNRITNNKYIVTDREHIIAASNSNLIDTNLSSELEELLSNCKEILNEKKNFTIMNEHLEGYMNIEPIIIDNDRSGMIIEYNDLEISSNHIIKVFKNLIETKLNNY